MPANVEDELAGLRKELNDLKSATAEVNPPLHPRTLAVALTKIATLRRQIRDFEEKRRDAKRRGQS